MYWLSRLAVCGLAVLFAASGVRKAAAPDAGSWQVARGAARVVFGTAVVAGTVWSAVRRGKAEPPPAPAAPGAAPDDGGR